MSGRQSIRDALVAGEAKLAGQVETPRSEAAALLAAATGYSRATLIAFPERVVETEALNCYRQWLEARKQGRPIAYITGVREFWSLPFRVSPAVLIPRPETEHLVEFALQRLARGSRVLDLGTGSGAVAVALAHERPDLVVTAVELSSEALEVAAANAARHAAGRIRLVQGDWFEPIAGERFDVIIGNPPYISTGEAEAGLGDVRFEPPRALLAGARGLDHLTRIVAAAPDHLAPGGRLLVEHGWRQGEAVRALFHGHGLLAVETRCDLAGHERVTLGYAGIGRTQSGA